MEWGPTWLHVLAKAEWRRVAPLMLAAGRISELDTQTLAAYCQSYARWRECEQTIAKEGPVFKGAARPEVMIGHRALGSMRQLAKQLGIGAQSRARINKTEREAGRAIRLGAAEQLQELRERARGSRDKAPPKQVH